MYIVFISRKEAWKESYQSLLFQERRAGKNFSSCISHNLNKEKKKITHLGVFQY